MTRSEYENLKIVNEHGIFYPNAIWTKNEPIKNAKGDIIDFELVGYSEKRTAQQVYEIDYPASQIPQPTPTEQNQTDIQKTQSLLLFYGAMSKSNQDDLLAELENLKAEITALRGVQ